VRGARIDNWHFDIAAFPTKRLNVWSAFPRNYATQILIGCLRLLDGLTFPLATFGAVVNESSNIAKLFPDSTSAAWLR
jgi:hypothetical protein